MLVSLPGEGGSDQLNPELKDFEDSSEEGTVCRPGLWSPNQQKSSPDFGLGLGLYPSLLRREVTRDIAFLVMALLFCNALPL